MARLVSFLSGTGKKLHGEDRPGKRLAAVSGLQANRSPKSKNIWDSVAGVRRQAGAILSVILSVCFKLAVCVVAVVCVVVFISVEGAIDGAEHWAKRNRKPLDTPGQWVDAAISALQEKDQDIKVASKTPDEAGSGQIAVSPATVVQRHNIAWEVTNEVDEDDPISKEKRWIARSQRRISDGGTIRIKATCEPARLLAFQFAAFNVISGGQSFEYEQVGKDGDSYLMVLLRIDNGDRLLALNAFSEVRYNNVAEIKFGIVGSNYKPPFFPRELQEETRAYRTTALNPAYAYGPAYFTAIEPQDITAFLKASVVELQFPLESGHTEIVLIYPGDSSFQQFLSECRMAVIAPGAALR